MKKFPFSVLLACLFALLPVSCAKENIPQTSDEPQLKITSPKDVSVILHAGGELDGMSLLNCQEAFYFYYELGYTIFEYDLKLSSDGKLIATHSWEHLTGGYDGIPYQEFTSLTLENGYTPVNEEWLIETFKEYPDITVVVDAKMPTTLLDAEVIKRLDRLGDTHGIDLSSRIIPKVFSIEMWDAIKNTTSFKKHLFSRYKEYYSIGTIVDNFPIDRFIGMALPYANLDAYYKNNIPYLQSLGYRIFAFGINNSNDATGALSIGADTIYIDGVDDLPN